MSFLALGKKVDPEDYIICKYFIDSDLTLEDAAGKLAEEESTGTWTEVPTEKKIHEFLGAKVIDIDKQEKIATVAFPNEEFSNFDEIGGIPAILSVIAGNLFGLEAIRNVRLIDVFFPKEIVRGFKGPKFGIQGIRNYSGYKNQPFVGGTVKPKIGLKPQDYGDFVYEIGMAGLTSGKDDETLISQKFCPLEERVIKIAEKLDQVKEETGRTVLYSVNVTTRADKILEVADLALENGANMLMVDVIVTGFSAVRALAEDPGVKVPIHCHRAMHAAFTRNSKHGIHMKVISKLVRLAGGDLLHIGTFGIGKMHAPPIENIECQKALTEDMHGLKDVLPIASGGLHPGSVEALINIAGIDIQIQAGGGVAGHPWGLSAGAKALRQAVDATLAGISLPEYAKEHKELAAALEYWGYVEPGQSNIYK